MAASKFGRLEGFAYQSPPPSYWRRAMVRRDAWSVERGALCVERRAWSVERDESPVSSTRLPASMATAVTPFRALRSTLHALRAGLRSMLHALRISLLLRDLIRPIAR